MRPTTEISTGSVELLFKQSVTRKVGSVLCIILKGAKTNTYTHCMWYAQKVPTIVYINYLCQHNDKLVCCCFPMASAYKLKVLVALSSETRFTQSCDLYKLSVFQIRKHLA